MYTATICVTPEIANNWLTKNTNNRKIDWRRVDSYATSMKQGLWQKNPEGISFYENGSLRNGQHRLLAVVQSGTSIEFEVTFDVPNDSVICDNQKTRTLQNFCQLSGKEDALCSKDITSCVNTLFAQYVPRTVINDSIKLRFIDDEHNSLLYLRSVTGKKHNRLAARAAVVSALFCALKCGVEERTIERFVDSLASGFVTSESEYAAIVLRNSLLKEKAGGRENSSKMFKIALRAINDFDNAIPRKRGYNKILTENLPYYDFIKEEVIKKYI